MKRFTDFDFGLTGLAGLFHQDWTNFGEVEDVVLAYLSVGDEAVANEAQQKLAASIRSDVVELAASDATDSQVETLVAWVTGANYGFEPGGESGRDFLRRVDRACEQWQKTYGTAVLESSSSWRSEELAEQIREIVRAAELKVPEDLRSPLNSNQAALRDALDVCIRSASPELTFRLLLRIIRTNFVPVGRDNWQRYQDVSAELALGSEITSALEFLVE